MFTEITVRTAFEEIILLQGIPFDALNREDNGEYVTRQIELMFRAFVAGVRFGSESK